eukprot:3659063-Amphidinium_carterae.4
MAVFVSEAEDVSNTLSRLCCQTAANLGRTSSSCHLMSWLGFNFVAMWWKQLTCHTHNLM